MSRKRLIIDFIVISVVTLAIMTVAAHADGPPNAYVLMALQQGTDGEGNPIYTLINGAQEVEIPASKGYTMATNGVWRMVRFYLAEIKPEAWGVGQAADWLSQADGFLAFDFRALGEYARASRSIQGRAFDYDAVLDAVLQYEWWIEEDGTYNRYSGNKAAYIAAGAPKLMRVMPMPHHLSIPNDTYGD